MVPDLHVFYRDLLCNGRGRIKGKQKDTDHDRTAHVPGRHHHRIVCERKAHLGHGYGAGGNGSLSHGTDSQIKGREVYRHAVMGDCLVVDTFFRYHNVQ